MGKYRGIDESLLFDDNLDNLDNLFYFSFLLLKLFLVFFIYTIQAKDVPARLHPCDSSQSPVKFTILLKRLSSVQKKLTGVMEQSLSA